MTPKNAIILSLHQNEDGSREYLRKIESLMDFTIINPIQAELRFSFLFSMSVRTEKKLPQQGRLATVVQRVNRLSKLSGHNEKFM